MYNKRDIPTEEPAMEEDEMWDESKEGTGLNHQTAVEGEKTMGEETGVEDILAFNVRANGKVMYEVKTATEPSLGNRKR